MRLRFVSAIGGSAFMEELLSVVAFEVAQLGVEVSEHSGAYPPSTGDDIFVVIPHEYFVVTPKAAQPTPRQLRRTIAFAVEHPGNDTFEVSAQWCARLGAIFDINDDSRAELGRRGLASERFRLGYSPLWDRWHGDDSRDRPIDVTYLGTTEPRRSRALASYGRELAPWEVRLLMPPHEPMIKPRPDFLMGSAKLDHLAASKLLINLHRGESRSLEWVRVLEALCNGCVVVSEQSPDFSPLVPGRHIVFGDALSLGEQTAFLLRHPEMLAEIRRSGYEFVRDQLRMHESASHLTEVAGQML